MKTWYCLIFLLLTFSCTESQVEDPDPPACLETYKDDPNTSAIHSYKLDAKMYYWIETGARHVDGNELVVDDTCQEHCGIGGLLPAKCSERFDMTKWKEVWKR